MIKDSDYELSNVSISQLSDIAYSDNLSDETLLLISQPWKEGKFGYISEKTSFGDIKHAISSSLDLDKLVRDIKDLQDVWSKISCENNVLSIRSLTKPYIISCIVEKNGLITSVSGYVLSNGMDTVFKETKFQTISSENLTIDNTIEGQELSTFGQTLEGVNKKSLRNVLDYYVMPTYSENNQIATSDFVNSSINAVAAYYITRKHQGETTAQPFTTYQDLLSTEVSELYNGTEKRKPTKNDYCIVLSDESEGTSTYGTTPVTTRYSYTGSSEDDYDSAKWSKQYVVNSSPFTDAQWKTVNSGVTKDNRVTRPDKQGVGSTTIPVYVDTDGNAKQITSYSGTSDRAKNDNDGNQIDTTYLHLSAGEVITNDLSVLSSIYSGGDKVATQKEMSAYIESQISGEISSMISSQVSSMLSTSLCGVIAPLISNIISSSVTYEEWIFTYENAIGELCSITKLVASKNKPE